MHDQREPALATDIGRQIQEARLAAEIPTGAMAARKAGMHVNNYWRLEHRSSHPSWSTVHRVIVDLGLHLERFFPEQMILAAAHRIARKNGQPK